MKLLLLVLVSLAVTQAREVVSRIVNGVEVVPHSIPYQAALLLSVDNDTFLCSGSLINPTTILTAAHCVDTATRALIILGAHNITSEEPEQIRVNSTNFIVHEGYDKETISNDIAIIKIDPVQLNENVQTIPLPSTAWNIYWFDLASASGWGKTEDSSSSQVLRKAKLRIMCNFMCNVYFYPLIINDGQICGKTWMPPFESTCSGDSGGPLVASSGELIGITSFGLSTTCNEGNPAVFTRVTAYLDWIAKYSQ